jgi:ABC-type Fe3+/spermidine/putrescine transport system ATPase subunit
MTSVQLHQLNKSYDGQHHAVADLTLEMASGKITALLGPSGCGKTTILKMIAGLLTPSDGDILYNGQSVLNIPAERRGAVMVFQNHLLFPHMTVAENVAFGLKMRGTAKVEIARRVTEMLDLVKLSGYERRRPGQLSGGQQQRVALARALVVQPRALLLDEPLSNLDAHLRQEMRDLIFNLQRQFDITTIFVTHDQEEAVILADYVALLFDGRLQQFGEPGDFYERPSTRAIARFFGSVNFIAGHKAGDQVETPLGRFCVPNHAQPDGPVTLTIRPENIALSAPLSDFPTANQVNGRVLNHIYVGTHTRFRIQTDVPDLPPLELLADAASQRHYEDGDPVTLHFPLEKIWLLPG